MVLYHFFGYSASDTMALDSTALNIISVVLSIAASLLLMYAGIRSMKKAPAVK